MNYGPELISALVPELRGYCGCQLQRVEAGSDWCVLTFKNKGSLFFTWNPEIFGICSITSNDLRELRAQSVRTPFAPGDTIPADSTATIASEYVAPFFGSCRMQDMFFCIVTAWQP